MRRSVLLLASTALALLLSCGVALVGVVLPAQAAFPGENGKIAFVRDGNLYAMDADGDPQNALPSGTEGADPAWSADGSKLAFVRGGDIHVMAADGSGELSNITNSAEEECSPTWSPNGTKIAYARNVSDSYYGCESSTWISSQNWTQDIFVKNADGSGDPVNLAPYGVVADPVWSPDGTKIAFVTRDTYYPCSGCSSEWTSRIYTMNATDGSNKLQRTDAQWNSTSPDWSPDGAKIVFASNQYGSYSNGYSTEILTMDFDGTDTVRLTTDSYSDSSPAYSPDGTRIAFTSTRISGNSEVYTIGANGGGLTNIANNVAHDITPDWQPVDNTPPETTLDPSGPPNLTNSTSASFSFSSEVGATFECKLNAGAFERCEAPKNYTALPSGSYTFSVRAIDAAGNVDATPEARTWTVDTVLPTVSGISPRHASTTRDTTPLIRATVKDNATLAQTNVKLYVAGKLVPATRFSYAPSTGALVHNSAKLPKGKKTVKIVATDAAGNVGIKTWFFTIK